jgi:hypothetical protein
MIWFQFLVFFFILYSEAQRFAAWRMHGIVEHKTVNTPQKLMQGRMFI